ncbi:T9SS type A sorting domain-containing protein [Pontibacter sp. HSC-14F20]|uniref:T9SS type A sorting domain-containing protein n=1 Tax=Pontibacter sp. HSC-14F20 TaxID=2864136 RepID=UPI001C73241C|nr:T9SS type A sorting domain-containing protein [Pontibacter sp. HSC-14F20]MBX0332433.1 T9SS type A sorting domain-containing protein [Pontibacter sp. HSC-14F20]
MKTLLQLHDAKMRLIDLSKWLPLCLTLLLCLASTRQAQGQEIEWDKTIGGFDDDALTSLQQTADGGYILGGYSKSDISGDKSESSKGFYDYWIVKLDANGNKEWDKTYGGSSSDILITIKQTQDGGYILGGRSYSDISGDKNGPLRGSEDYWIIKLDATGNKEWDRTFGGDGQDIFTSIQQTGDGGYILGGFSDSGISGDKSEAQKGSGDELVWDYWVVKVDASGNKEWDRTIGGNDSDRLQAIQQTLDGGYILGGYSNSGISDDKSEASRGGYDFWIVKINANGGIVWDKTYGGDNHEVFGSLQQIALEQTLDGGYILGGSSASGISGDKTEVNRGQGDDAFNYDFWVVKIDANGAKEWDKTFGGDSNDNLVSLQQTIDNGYILGGSSESGISGEKSEPSGEESNDYWVVKIDANGILEWEKTIGGNGIDMLQSLQQTLDGGYILGGSSNAGAGRDKTEPNYATIDPESTDYWIVKLSGESTCTPPTPAIAVIPSSKVYTGGDPATLYLGYGPQRVRLQASGAERYEWNPATGLSSRTLADPIFTPTAAGTYTFTLTAYNGTCSTIASVTITVEDVRCGNGKVLVCHNGKPLCIATAAVEAHLRNHKGDKLGNCTPASAVAGTPIMALRAYPNPFQDRTNVEFSLTETGAYRLELYNANGKMLSKVAQGKGKAGELVKQELESRKLKEGIHYLRLISDNEVQTVRLVLKK